MWTTYVSNQQLTPPPNLSKPLDPSGIKNIQKIIGVALYYVCSSDANIITFASTIDSHQTQVIKKISKDVTKLINYMNTHPNAKTLYSASDMVLHLHSYASCLSEEKSCSRSGILFLLSTMPTNNLCQPQPQDPMTPNNVVIVTNRNIIKSVLS